MPESGRQSGTVWCVVIWQCTQYNIWNAMVITLTTDPYIKVALFQEDALLVGSFGLDAVLQGFEVLLMTLLWQAC